MLDRCATSKLVLSFCYIFFSGILEVLLSSIETKFWMLMAGYATFMVYLQLFQFVLTYFQNV